MTLSRRRVERLLALGAEEDGPALELERYELGEVLGRGGMGVVHRAHDRELDRPVAIKLLSDQAAPSEEARLRFLREARAAARLVHPHIAAVYDATPEWIVMRLVEGENLATLRLPPRELVSVMRDAALAIHFAHVEGIVHRDIKPANLMVESSGERPHVFVMDFGLVKELEVDTSLSAAGGVLGTPAFMAPEQAAARSGEVGPRTDVYGLGATLYHGLSGAAPFEGELFEVLRATVEEEPVPLQRRAPEVGADLSWIVARCLEKNPARRYATALDLAGDLDRWLRGEPVLARPPTIAYRLRRFVSRRQGILVASVVAALLVALIVTPFLWMARAKLEAAVAAQELADEVFGLSEQVRDALDLARDRRQAGSGLERLVTPILEEAAVACLAFLAEHDLAHAWSLLGQLRHQQGQLDPARDAYERAQELDPELPGVDRALGMVLAEMYREQVPVLQGEEMTPAIEALRATGASTLARSFEEDPEAETADEIYALGMLHWLEEDELGAIQELRAAIELEPMHLAAHLALARLHAVRDEEAEMMAHSVYTNDILQGNRAAYLGRFIPVNQEQESLPRTGDLCALQGAEELWVDCSVTMWESPSNAANYALRGQVQARQALRTAAGGNRLEALLVLERALSEYDNALLLAQGDASFLVNRGAARACLARLYASGNQFDRAAQLRAQAREDYDAALAAAPVLAPARFDRALLSLWEADLSVLAFDAAGRKEALRSARADATAALAAVEDDDRYRARFEELIASLPETP